MYKQNGFGTTAPLIALDIFFARCFYTEFLAKRFSFLFLLGNTIINWGEKYVHEEAVSEGGRDTLEPREDCGDNAER
jgi:hypothetical protein